MNSKIKDSDMVIEIKKHNHSKELENLEFKKAKDDFNSSIDSLNKWIHGIKYFDEFCFPINAKQELFKQYTIQKNIHDLFSYYGLIEKHFKHFKKLDVENRLLPINQKMSNLYFSKKTNKNYSQLDLASIPIIHLGNIDEYVNL